MDICKKKKAVSEEELKKEFGRKWIWTAIDASTKLLACFVIGDRTLEDARCFLKKLTLQTGKSPLFVSDELPHYADGLLELFHELATPEPTGLPGRPKKPEKIVDTDLNYATVHKTRDNGRIVKVEQNIIYGSKDSVEEKLKESSSDTINTSFVERTNLNWRLWDAHLVRKSIAFAKSIKWLTAKFSICATFYNFLRPHETLSRGTDRKFKATTPAMAANITDHVWTVQEILGYRVLCQ